MKTTRRTRREARRLYQACLAGGRLDARRAREAAAGVAKSRRRRSLAVLSHFHRLVRLDDARHRAVVEMAAPLADDFRSRLESVVGRVYGAGMSTSFRENPALIAGICVTVGSDVYDGSVRTALARLQERFR